MADPICQLHIWNACSGGIIIWCHVRITPDIFHIIKGTNLFPLKWKFLNIVLVPLSGNPVRDGWWPFLKSSPPYKLSQWDPDCNLLEMWANKSRFIYLLLCWQTCKEKRDAMLETNILLLFKNVECGICGPTTFCFMQVRWEGLRVGPRAPPSAPPLPRLVPPSLPTRKMHSTGDGKM